MRLAAFIEHNHKKIIKEWVEFARSLKPWSEGMSDEALADHAESLLDAIVSDLALPQSHKEKAEKSKGHGAEGALTGVGRKHATDRLESGFKLNQLVSEYRALRASVVRMWAEAHGDKQGELTRFNEAIDETLAQSANRYADLLNRTREQFLAVLGHDLRTPLGAIAVGAAILTKSESLDDKHARIASRILNSAGRMNRMVNSLLDLTRTRLGGSIPLTRLRMDLATVCRQAIAELELIHPDRSLKFESTGNVAGDWDSDRISQVIANLLGNALQYSEAAVNVVVEGTDDEVVLAVHNEGQPISENGLKNIFEPMVRGAAPGRRAGDPPAERSDRNANGLGLGLYIAHEVVLAHGGTIDVASSEKEGTTFTVHLPRQPARDRRESRAEEDVGTGAAPA